MTNLDKLKNLVHRIQKAAQAAPPPPAGYTVNGPPAPGSAGGTPTTPPSGTIVHNQGYYGNSNVREMQKAIQSFANQVVAYKVDPKNPTKVSPDDTRKDFNDFLAEQYSAGSKIHGSEFDPSPEATTQDQKRPTDLIELDNVIDGLRRIGPGKKEALPDGVWDFRTNNAIKNIYAIADALIRVSDDFGGIFPNSTSAFREADLNKMGKLIPKEKDPRKINRQILSTKAQELIPLIEKLTEFYKTYSKYVLNHPAYKGYIDKSKPLVKVTPGTQDPGLVPDNLKQYMDKLDQLFLTNVKLPAKNGTGGFITIGKLPLSYIKDLESLQALMVKFLGFDQNDVTNPEIQSQVLNAIMANSNNVQSSPNPAQQHPSTNKNIWDRV